MVETKISRNIPLAPYPTAAGSYRRAPRRLVLAAAGHGGRRTPLAAGPRSTRARTLPPSAWAVEFWRRAT
jgi:hypothetical protein